MSAVLDDRIAERRAEVRAERRRRRLRRTVTVALVLVVVGALVAVERSSLVALESVRVEGTQRLADAEVVEAAGLEVGRSVLRLPLGRAERDVAALPLVAEVEVARDGPLGVVVRVTEAVPALVAVGGDRRVLVDAAGTVLAAGDADGVPRVELDGPPPAPGGDVGAQPALGAAHGVVASLPGPLAALVDHVVAPGPDAVVLVLVDGTRVRWGDDARNDEKARSLGAVLEDLDGTVVAVVDVRAPSAPAVTPLGD